MIDSFIQNQIMVNIFKYNLGALNQWRNVDYVEIHGSDVTCLLCDTGNMHKKEASRHFNGKRHASKYNQTFKDQQDFLQTKERNECIATKVGIACIVGRQNINKLGHSVWKHHMKSLLYSYISNECTMDVVCQYLAKYDLMERTSLLELTILRNYRIQQTNHDKKLPSTTSTDDDDDKLFSNKEPNKNTNSFTTSRIVCGCHIIIPLVLQYIDERNVKV